MSGGSNLKAEVGRRPACKMTDVSAPKISQSKNKIKYEMNSKAL